MSVVDRNRRMSMIGIGSPVPRVLSNPDGVIGANERGMFLYLYYGIAPQPTPAPTRDLTLPTRNANLTLKVRLPDLTLPARTPSLTLPARD